METKIPELSTVSSRGQLVVPKGIRNKLHLDTGSVVALTVEKNIVLIKKIEDPILKEDIKIAEEVAEAWKRIEQGKGKEYTREEFLKEIKKW